MPEYDEAYALAQDALAAAEAADKRVAELRDKLGRIMEITEERVLRIEMAFKQYVREAPSGPFAARERALSFLYDGE